MIREKLKLVPKKYTAFLSLGFTVILLSPYVAHESGLFNRSSQTILTDIQKFESCSFNYEINEKGVGKYGRYHHDITDLNCELSEGQRQVQNVIAALELEKSLQEEVKGLNVESKKEISDRIMARNARLNPEQAVAQIAISSTSEHFESCEITNKDGKNTIECIVTPDSAKDPKLAAVIKEGFDNMNIRIAQLDNKSVNALAERIKEVRSKELSYKVAQNKDNKPT